MMTTDFTVLRIRNVGGTRPGSARWVAMIPNPHRTDDDHTMIEVSARYASKAALLAAISNGEVSNHVRPVE